MVEKNMKKFNSYYDGIPPEILAMSLEEIEEAIKKENEKIARMTQMEKAKKNETERKQ